MSKEIMSNDNISRKNEPLRMRNGFKRTIQYHFGANAHFITGKYLSMNMYAYGEKDHYLSHEWSDSLDQQASRLIIVQGNESAFPIFESMLVGIMENKRLVLKYTNRPMPITNASKIKTEKRDMWTSVTSSFKFAETSTIDYESLGLIVVPRNASIETTKKQEQKDEPLPQRKEKPQKTITPKKEDKKSTPTGVVDPFELEFSESDDDSPVHDVLDDEDNCIDDLDDMNTPKSLAKAIRNLYSNFSSIKLKKSKHLEIAKRPFSDVLYDIKDVCKKPNVAPAEIASPDSNYTEIYVLSATEQEFLGSCSVAKHVYCLRDFHIYVCFADKPVEE